MTEAKQQQQKKNQKNDGFIIALVMVHVGSAPRRLR